MLGKRKPVEVIFHEDFKAMDIPVLGLVLKWTDCTAGVREVGEEKLIAKQDDTTKKVTFEKITTKENKNVWIYQTDNPDLMRFLLYNPQKKSGRINPREVVEKGWLTAAEVKGLIEQTDTPVFPDPRPRFDFLTRYECEQFAVGRGIAFDPKSHIEDFRAHLAQWWDNEQPTEPVDSPSTKNDDREAAHPPGESTGSVGLFESEDHNGTD